MFGSKFLNEYYDKRPYENGILAHCKQCRYKHNDNGLSDYEYLVNHLKERHPESYKVFHEKTNKYMMEGMEKMKNGFSAWHKKEGNNSKE